MLLASAKALWIRDLHKRHESRPSTLQRVAALPQAANILRLTRKGIRVAPRQTQAGASAEGRVTRAPRRPYRVRTKRLVRTPSTVRILRKNTPTLAARSPVGPVHSDWWRPAVTLPSITLLTSRPWMSSTDRVTRSSRGTENENVARPRAGLGETGASASTAGAAVAAMDAAAAVSAVVEARAKRASIEMGPFSFTVIGVSLPVMPPCQPANTQP